MNDYEIAARDLDMIEAEFGIDYYFNFEREGFNEEYYAEETEKELGDWYGY